MIAKRIQIKILCLALIFLISGGIILSAFSIRASAETTTYSGVLEDLSKDETFNPEDYPVIPGDYSLHLITIAEGENGELFVYVYQPVASTRNLATSINISTSVRTKNVFENYPLELLDFSNVFFKYKVCDFTVSSDAERYYEIPSIFRSWNKDYGDEDPGADNAVSEVSFPVGKQFKYTTGDDGNISLSVDDVEYIEIQDKFVGYVRYTTAHPSFNLFQSEDEYTGTDAHFVAFSTKRQIDDLLQADVYYIRQDGYLGITGWEWEEEKPCYEFLDYEQFGIYRSDGIFVSNTSIWDRIQSTENFLTSSDKDIFCFPGFFEEEDIAFTNEAKQALKATDWVLSFVETDYINRSLNDTVIHKYSRVGDVSLLRLRFVTNGVIYDLGVVDNKQTGSEDPSAKVEYKVPDLLEKIISILLFGVFIWVLTLLSPFISTLLKIAWDLLKIAIRCVLDLIALPFKLISGLFKYK